MYLKGEEDFLYLRIGYCFLINKCFRGLIYFVFDEIDIWNNFILCLLFFIFFIYIVFKIR